MEPIYLCRDESKFIEWYADHATHVALTRAEYDAREARLVLAEQARDEARMMLNRMGELRADEIERADAATARADAADERAKAAEALLRELRAIVRGECPSLLDMDSGANDIDVRIDAHLDAPTPDDRRGEDGEWCKP